MGLAMATGLACAMFWATRHDFTAPSRPIFLAQASRQEVAQVVPGATSKDAGKAAAAKDAAKETKSAAERIGALSRGLDDDRKQLEALKGELENPQGEYQKAEAEFKLFDTRRADSKKQMQKLRDAGKSDEADKLGEALKSLEEQWSRARDRFNLLIDERKTLQEKASALGEKIQRDQSALDKLTGKADIPSKQAQAKPPEAKQPGAKPPEAPATAPNSEKTVPAKTGPGQTVPAKTTAAQASDTKPSGAATPTASPNPEPPTTINAASAADDGKGVLAQPPDKAKKPPSKELLKAQDSARAKEEAARAAQEKAADIGQRRTTLDKNVEVESKLLATAQLKVEQAEQSKAALKQELEKKADAPGAERAELHAQLREVERRLVQARAEVEAGAARLQELRGELAGLAADEAAAVQEEQQTANAARKAQQEVARLENPFAPQNMFRWLLAHGPKLLTIVIAMLLLHQFVRHFSRRIIHFVAGRCGRIDAESESRAQTLVGVFRNFTSLVILGGGTLMLLEEVGIPIVPLLGGAAVIGLAVAFGAQNLIRDYFSGFMILLEDQYNINDVVKIGSTAGLVEKITLRMTVVRDLEGVAHFIPHGTIATVSNMTHGFSRALFDIHISYAEDPERVIALLTALAKDLRQDPVFGPLVLEDPEMLGVDEFAESSVVIKFFIKTQPLMQWRVKRELL